jgi:hypothetical protein
MSRAFAVCKGGLERGGEIFPFCCSRHVLLAVSLTGRATEATHRRQWAPVWVWMCAFLRQRDVLDLLGLRYAAAMAIRQETATAEN